MDEHAHGLKGRAALWHSSARLDDRFASRVDGVRLAQSDVPMWLGTCWAALDRSRLVPNKTISFRMQQYCTKSKMDCNIRNIFLNVLEINKKTTFPYLY
jgi:hypothetical protein